MLWKNMHLLNTILFLLYIIKNQHNMKRLSITSLCVLVAAVATMALLAGARLADAVDCSPSELSPCLEAIRSSSVMPSSTCCVKMEEQAPCLCQYAKIPEWKPFISGGQRVAAVCGVNLPVC